MGPQLTKRSTVLGLPIGPKRTDWAQVGKLAAMGVGVVSTAAGGGVGVKAAGSKLKGRAPDDAQSADVDHRPHIIEESIDVAVPVETAYNQWTQFTEMPSILRGVQGVDQEADDQVRWTVRIGPARRRWTARIVEQIPDERIVWESTDGTENRGSVTFHRLDDHLTRVQVEMEYFPHGAIERVGNVFRAARRRTRKDLRLFKHHLELAGSETGGWRGEIHGNGNKAGGGTKPKSQKKSQKQHAPNST
jgi:uncharacterized membrane protein